MSFFDAQVDSVFGASFGLFAGNSTVSSFTDSSGNVTSDLDTFWRAESSELREDSFGNLSDVTVCQVGVKRSQLATIDLEGTFTDRAGVLWDVDSMGASGQGVETQNSRFALVNVKRRDANTQSPGGRRSQ